MEGSTAANPIIVDDEEDKENSAPTTTTTSPESECPTEPPRLLRSRPFGTRLENVPESVYSPSILRGKFSENVIF